MRAAVLLPGQMRCYPRCLPMLTECVFRPFNADVFISTWLEDNQRLAEGVLAASDDGTIQEAIRNTPRLTGLRVIRWDETIRALFDTHKYDANRWEKSLPEKNLAQWYQVWCANQLKCDHERLHGFKYDVVIRCRSDALFEKPIDPGPIMPMLSAHTVVIPEIYDWGLHPWGLGNDQIGIGTSEVMDMYCDLYNNIDRIFAHGVTFHSETMLAYHFRMNNVRQVRRAIAYQMAKEVPA